MKVSAVCFGQMREFLPEDAEGNRATLELDDEAAVADLVHCLGAPERLVYVLLVNGERAGLERGLADGDEVTLMPPYTGGSSSDDLVRCDWALPSALMSDYHDTEWGVPLRDDRGQFEFLVLEGVQAGLSWSTVLNKRANYREALDGFDPEKIARYDETKVESLLLNSGLIRNRMKMNAAVANAQAFLAVRDSEGSFSDYIWKFVGGEPVVNRYKNLDDLPAETDASRAMSKDLKRLGFKFVGPTICYAHMQATGMVNDHIVSCWRHKPLA
ncbi:MAG: DNA-3-methyladenine glycosylase I [Actinomycetota bacterium]